MKKLYSITMYIAVLLFSGILLTGCGERKENNGSGWKGIQAGTTDLSVITGRTEYYDIVAESEEIFHWARGGTLRPVPEAVFIRMQYYQGEPAQLWLEPNPDRYGIPLSWDVCLYRTGGSREVLLREVPAADRYNGYLDQEGNLYCWENATRLGHSNGETEEVGTILMKYSPSGELLFERQYDYGDYFRDICQTPDGRIYLVLDEMGVEGSMRLAELETDTGLMTELEAVRLPEQTMNIQKLGIQGEKLARFKFRGYFDNEITAINVENGSEDCILSFLGTSYGVPDDYDLQDFRVLEDGSVELLWAAWDRSESLWERLRMEKVEKIPIVLRGDVGELLWLGRQINHFNRQNETYHVIVEDCGPGNDREDFARLTSVQIASGKGPDILCGSLMQDYIPGMLEKGALEDLRPYMERSGIREEDYFPFTFAVWRDGDKICGISPASPSLEGYSMDALVLGGMKEPDIETLVDVLLSGQENAVFLKGYDSWELLELFYKGTESLWGMVDWEKRSCDFSGELFAGILEAAKRYGDSGDNREVNCIAGWRSFGSIYTFDDRQEREESGLAICGVLFDDGCHTAVSSVSALAINANSSNREGAWEFIAYLLGEEAQSEGSGVPVSRRAFEAWAERQRKQFADGREIYEMHYERLADGSSVYRGETKYTAADVTDEIVAEYVGMLEAARPCPASTIPILGIIREEAADYFQGSKDAEAVSRLVTNRVQLYLDEGK